jgi:MFS transporter, DHA1 family, multidrug resistance protein
LEPFLKTVSRPRNSLLILILGSLTALSPFSIDLYLPAFPDIARDLDTSVARIALSLSSYFIGLSFGQLFYGPFLDRFGRKRPLYTGLSIYIIASIGCLYSQTIETLIAFRFLQALGGCAANVAAVSMVRDFFSLREGSKVFSLLILILGASPLLAPTIGGYVATHFGWHSVFVILAAMAATLLFVSARFLPEGHEPDPSVSLKLPSIIRGFIEILKNPQFYTYAFSGAVAFAGLFIYVASSPIIFMNIFKVSPQIYGWLFAMLSVGFIGASQINILLLRRFRNEQILSAVLIVQSITALVFLGGSLIGNGYGLKATFPLLFVFLGCVGFANPNAASLALAPFSQNAGRASALLGFIQMGIGAVASLGIGLMSGETMLPIVCVFAGSAWTALVIFRFGRTRIIAPISVGGDGAAGAGAH